MPELLGTATIEDPDLDALGPAMLACNPGQRRFVLAALQFPTGKDWQLAKAAGYSQSSHGYLRRVAHSLKHNEKVIAAMREEADKQLRSNALLGVSVIAKIARTDGHRDQLKAAEALADRVGFHRMTEHKVSVEHKRPQDIIDLAVRLAKEIGVAEEKLLGHNRAAVLEGEFVVVKKEDENG
jgi:hypothetical protein